MRERDYAAIVIGALMALAGAFLTVSLLWPNVTGGWGTSWACLLGPSLMILGLVSCVRGFFGAGMFSRRNLLISGLILIVVGAYPWAYIGLLFGGRPGNESEGMLGFLLFIALAIPGLILTVTSFFRNE